VLTANDFFLVMFIRAGENAAFASGGLMQVQQKLSPALWRLLALLTVSVVVNYIDRGNLSTAAPLLKDELGLTTSQLGILLSSFFWAYAGFMVLAGWLADRLDVNWVLAVGFFTWCAATVGTGFAHGFAALLIARLALGMGESVSWPCYCTLLARHFPEHRRGMANAAIAIGMGIGPAVGMFTGGILMARFGWRSVFISLGLGGLLWLPAWLKWMPTAQAPALLETRETTPGILEIVKQRSAWGTFLGCYSQGYLWYLLLTWIPFYLVRERHFSMDKMAEITGAAYLCTTVFTTVSGWLSDRWIASGGSPTLVRKTFVGVGQTCSGICLLLCSVTRPAVSVVCLLLAFSFYGFYVAHVWAITQTLAGPRAAGQWFGVQNFFGSVAGILAPAVTGFMVSRTGSFFWPFAITASVAVLGSFCWVFVVGSVKQVVWTQPKASDLLRAAAETA
jgi:MFS transporter, ACS family, D-galactonate transporter